MANEVITKINTVGSRAYVTIVDDFGNINRPSFLGLKNAPVLQMDDGTLRGFAGEQAMESVVPVDVGKNAIDQTIDLPVDVRITGIAQLTAAGVPTETQALLFDNWRTKLTKAQRTQYSNVWQSTSSSSPEEKVAFVQSMISMLSSL
jgi:hypothetical protein